MGCRILSAVLEIAPRAMCVQGRHLSKKLYLQPDYIIIENTQCFVPLTIIKNRFPKFCILETPKISKTIKG